MKKRLALAFLGIVLTIGVIVLILHRRHPRERRPDAPPPALAERSYALPNGLHVDLVSGPCGNSIGVAMLLEFGSDHDPEGRSGMSRVIERLLSAADDAHRTDSGIDHVTDAVLGSSSGLDHALEEVAARMRHWEIAQADFERARTSVLEDIARRHGGDAEATALSFASESVRPTPSGFLGGVASEVQSLTLADVQHFVDAHVTVGNARLAIAGNIDPARVRARIEQLFQPLPSGTTPARRPFAPASVTGTIVMGDSPRAIALAVPAPAASDANYPAFLVVAARLAPSATGSQAWQGTYDPIHAAEALLVIAPMEPNEQPDPAATRVRTALSDRLRTPITPNDIAAARERFGLLLPVDHIAPARCAADPRALAIARARAAQLGIDSSALDAAIARTTEADFERAGLLFAPHRTAAVAAGGVIR